MIKPIPAWPLSSHRYLIKYVMRRFGDDTVFADGDDM